MTRAAYQHPNAAAFPVIEAGEVTQFNLLHRRWKPVALELGGTLFTLCPGGNPRGFEGRSVAIAVTVGHERATLTVPVALIDEIIAKAGGSTFTDIGPGSTLLLLEHLLTDQVSALEAALGETITFEDVSLSSPRAASPVMLQCVTATRSYHVEVVLEANAAAFLARAASAAGANPAALSSLPIEVGLRKGSARISRRLLESVRPGDVIVADAICAKNRAVAVVGERLAASAVIENESLRLLTPFTRLSGSELENWSMTEHNTPRPADDAQQGHIDDIAVKLAFEMGRRDMSLGDLKTIAPGYIFDLSRTPENAIEIYAGSQRIGQGEIVQIGDALGVRVTRLFHNE